MILTEYPKFRGHNFGEKMVKDALYEIKHN